MLLALKLSKVKPEISKNIHTISNPLQESVIIIDPIKELP